MESGPEGTLKEGDGPARPGGALNVAVIGAGIVGSSVAYRLSEGGAEVVLIDGAEPGSGTTSTSSPGSTPTTNSPGTISS